MSEISKKAKGLKAKAKDVQQKTQQKLGEAKDRVSLVKLFKNFWEKLKSGKSKEAFAAFGAILLTVSKKLKGLKNEVDEDRQEADQEDAGQEDATAEKKEEKAQETPPATTDSGDDKKKKGPPKPKKTADRLSAAALAKFRKGELTTALSTTFSGVEVHGGLRKLETTTSKDSPGVPEWDYNNSKKTTHEWDWQTEGNTEEKMKKGLYCIQAAKPPEGYTRSGTNNVPASIKPKLTAIARALRTDPRMPLFKGIAMTVDGVEVMMVKEIHMHPLVNGKKPKPSLSDHYYQPHTGVSYVMKKKS